MCNAFFSYIELYLQELESQVALLTKRVTKLMTQTKLHHAVRRDIDILKREVRSLKHQDRKNELVKSDVNNGHSTFKISLYDKFRGWMPSLTNPKRIDKLTRYL